MKLARSPSGRSAFWLSRGAVWSLAVVLVPLGLVLVPLGVGGPRARAAASRASGKHLVVRNDRAMGTEIRLSVYTDDEEGAARAMEFAFQEIQRIEALMTTWREDSEVSRVNASAGVAPVVVSDETLEVVQMADRASRLSDGAFDITFYALRGLWKFDEDLDPRLPDPAEVKRRLPLVDYRKLVIDPKAKTLFLQKKGMAINLGGIAKGYAVDRAVAILRRAGFVDAIVQAGGDLMCSGSKGGEPWTSGIRDPRGGRGEPFAVMKLVNHAFSTAGDYERFFMLDGARYHHILDPKTGYPATRSRSVTIYAPSALLADAIDDAVFILGWQKGLAMIEKLDDVGAVVVDASGEVHVSRRIQERVRFFGSCRLAAAATAKPSATATAAPNECTDYTAIDLPARTAALAACRSGASWSNWPCDPAGLVGGCRLGNVTQWFYAPAHDRAGVERTCRSRGGQLVTP